METTQGLNVLRIALFIDFDNVILGVEDPPGFDVELVVNALRSRGSVVLGRAYGDWYRHSRHRRKLMEQGIELVETPVFGPIIKNSADIRIALDAFEIGMLQSHIDTFCMVSGDSDFLPLIKRLQYLGKHVIVIAGNKFTSDLVRRNCNEFISYENLLAESVGAMEDATVLDGAFHLLGRSIVTLNERGMEVRSSTVKQMMLQLNPVFSERTFGCNQFKQFLDKACRAGIVKLGGRDTVSGEYLVLLPGDEDIPTTEAGTNGAPAEAAQPKIPVRPQAGGRRTRSGRTFSGRDRAVTETAATTDPAISAPVDPGLADAATETVAETAPVELGAVPAIDAIPSPDPENALAGRTRLRRGRLRFSGKAAGSTPAALDAQPEGTQDLPKTDEALAEEAQTATSAAENAVEETVPAEASAEATADVAIGDEISAAPEQAPTEAGEASADETTETAPAKKRTTRGGRRRKSTTAKATEAEPVDADATPVTAEDAGQSTPAPVESTPEAAAPEAETPEAEAAPKKPARRRRATKSKPAAE